MNNKISFLSIFIFVLMGLHMDAREYDISDYLNPDNADRKAYIERYKDIAMAEMRRAGIPASIKLAQGILESGDGKSSLATEAKNHFGMKCGSQWEGDTYYLHDDDFNSDGELIKSCFRVFENPDESYYAHSEFLHNPKKIGRYGFLFNLDIRDYRAWAKGLKKSGYATNPRYAQLLIGIIEANRLYEYDRINLMDLELAEVSPLPTQPIVTPPGTPADISNVAKNEVVLNNGIRMIFAERGDSPKSIENFFGVKAKKVTIYNELYEGERLKFKDGDRVYLQAKRKKWRGKADYHEVKSGDTMYSIAQKYGLKTKAFRKKNRMGTDTEPAIGQYLALKRKIKKSRIIQIRDTSQDPVAIGVEEEEESYDLSDGKNIVDIIRSNVSAFDMKERTEAYVKITDGIVSAPDPIVTPSPQPNPSIPNPNPSIPKPDVPDVVVNPYPTPPPVIITPTPTPMPTPQPVGNYHTVASGDTLYSISRLYNASVDNIKRWNNLPSNIISIGQQLRVK